MNQSKELRLLKNIPMRTMQLSLISLTISSGIAVYFYILGLTMSAIMVGCFSLVAVGIILLQLLKIVRDVHTLVISSVCVLLVISGFIEGSATGQYFYFFPLVVSVPIVVDGRDSGKTEFIITFAVVLLSFATCFYAGHAIPPIEHISKPIANKIVYSNAASAIIVTLAFSVANIFYEKKFVQTLNTIAHIQSHEIRKPVASIIGLMDVWKREEFRYDTEIITMMERAVNELDQKIKLIVHHSSTEEKNQKRLVE